MERMERIKYLNVRGFCAQGIVGADATKPTVIGIPRAKRAGRLGT